MKHASWAAVIGGLLLAMARPAAAEPAREQVGMDRAEFMKTHTFDNACDCWVLREHLNPPAGIKSREQVKAERDRFFSTHVYSQMCDCWRPISGPPRNVSAMTRQQRRAATDAFGRTHEWDPASDSWVERKAVHPANEARRVAGRAEKVRIPAVSCPPSSVSSYSAGVR